MKTFRTACDPWGITVERVEVGGSVGISWLWANLWSGVTATDLYTVYLWVNAMTALHNNLANFPVSRWRTSAWRGTWWRASPWRPRPAGRPTVFSSCRKAKVAAWKKLSKDQVHSDIHVINKCCQPSNCDKSPVCHSDTLLCLQSRGRRDAGVLSFHCPQIPAGTVHLHLLLHILRIKFSLWLPYCNCPSIFSICLNLNLLKSD